MEAATRAVAKLNIDWPSEKQEALEKSKLDKSFLLSREQPPGWVFPFFPDLHAEVSKSWKKPFSSHLTSPTAHYYSSIEGEWLWDDAAG